MVTTFFYPSLVPRVASLLLLGVLLLRLARAVWRGGAGRYLSSARHGADLFRRATLLARCFVAWHSFARRRDAVRRRLRYAARVPLLRAALRALRMLMRAQRRGARVRARRAYRRWHAAGATQRARADAVATATAQRRALLGWHELTEVR